MKKNSSAYLPLIFLVLSLFNSRMAVSMDNQPFFSFQGTVNPSSSGIGYPGGQGIPQSALEMNLRSLQEEARTIARQNTEEYASPQKTPSKKSKTHKAEKSKTYEKQKESLNKCKDLDDFLKLPHSLQNSYEGQIKGTELSKKAHEKFIETVNDKYSNTNSPQSSSKVPAKSTTPSLQVKSKQTSEPQKSLKSSPSNILPITPSLPHPSNLLPPLKASSEPAKSNTQHSKPLPKEFGRPLGIITTKEGDQLQLYKKESKEQITVRSVFQPAGSSDVTTISHTFDSHNTLPIDNLKSEKLYSPVKLDIIREKQGAFSAMDLSKLIDQVEKGDFSEISKDHTITAIKYSDGVPYITTQQGQLDKSATLPNPPPIPQAKPTPIQPQARQTSGEHKPPSTQPPAPPAEAPTSNQLPHPSVFTKGGFQSKVSSNITAPPIIPPSPVQWGIPKDKLQNLLKSDFREPDLGQTSARESRPKESKLPTLPQAAQSLPNLPAQSYPQHNSPSSIPSATKVEIHPPQLKQESKPRESNPIPSSAAKSTQLKEPNLLPSAPELSSPQSRQEGKTVESNPPPLSSANITPKSLDIQHNERTQGKQSASSNPFLPFFAKMTPEQRTKYAKKLQTRLNPPPPSSPPTLTQSVINQTTNIAKSVAKEAAFGLMDNIFASIFSNTPSNSSVSQQSSVRQEQYSSPLPDTISAEELETIRSRTDDIQRISQRSGMTPAQLTKIKNAYLTNPSVPIIPSVAHAWNRIYNGEFSKQEVSVLRKALIEFTFASKRAPLPNASAAQPAPNTPLENNNPSVGSPETHVSQEVPPPSSETNESARASTPTEDNAHSSNNGKAEETVSKLQHLMPVTLTTRAQNFGKTLGLDCTKFEYMFSNHEQQEVQAGINKAFNQTADIHTIGNETFDRPFATTIGTIVGMVTDFNHAYDLLSVYRSIAVCYKMTKFAVGFGKSFVVDQLQSLYETFSYLVDKPYLVTSKLARATETIMGAAKGLGKLVFACIDSETREHIKEQAIQSFYEILDKAKNADSYEFGELCGTAASYSLNIKRSLTSTARILHFAGKNGIAPQVRKGLKYAFKKRNSNGPIKAELISGIPRDAKRAYDFPVPIAVGSAPSKSSELPQTASFGPSSNIVSKKESVAKATKPSKSSLKTEVPLVLSKAEHAPQESRAEPTELNIPQKSQTSEPIKGNTENSDATALRHLIKEQEKASALDSNLLTHIKDLDPTLLDIAQFKEAYNFLEKIPEALKDNSPVLKILKYGKVGSNPGDRGVAKGAWYETRKWVTLIKDGEKIEGVGVRYKDREFDFETRTKLIECKSIDWNSLSEAKIARMKSIFGDQLKIASDLGKAFEVHSDTKISVEFQNWFKIKGITIIQD
jgi:hypothetical protein